MSISTQDSIAIERASEKLANALNNSDVSLVADLFAETAAVLPPARAVVKGTAVLEFIRRMAVQSEGVKFMATDTDPFGPDLVREIGTMSMRLRRQNQERVSFKYLILWQKVGADWKLASLAWNRAAAQRGAQGQARGNRQQAPGGM